jgi:hypothetical protein
MAVSFNIKISNLGSDGLIKMKTQIDYDGLRIYHTQLPTFQNSDNKLALIGKFIDLSVYQTKLTQFNNMRVDWLYLKPRQ